MGPTAGRTGHGDPPIGPLSPFPASSTSCRTPRRGGFAPAGLVLDGAMMTSYDDGMRTIIEIPEEQLRALDAWRCARGISRAEAVRLAIASLLEDEARARASMEAAFGVWRGRELDGLAEQERLRAEWDQR